jgi:hypothetical protein
VATTENGARAAVAVHTPAPAVENMLACDIFVNVTRAQVHSTRTKRCAVNDVVDVDEEGVHERSLEGWCGWGRRRG